MFSKRGVVVSKNLHGKPFRMHKISSASIHRRFAVPGSRTKTPSEGPCLFGARRRLSLSHVWDGLDRLALSLDLGCVAV